MIAIWNTSEVSSFIMDTITFQNIELVSDPLTIDATV